MLQGSLYARLLLRRKTLRLSSIWAIAHPSTALTLTLLLKNSSILDQNTIAVHSLQSPTHSQVGLHAVLDYW